MIRALPWLLCAAALAGTACTAAAQPAYVPTTLRFDDLPTTGNGGAQVPAGYGGFDFGASGPTFYITRPAPAGSAADNAIAFSSTSTFVFARADQNAFYLDGVDFFSRRGLDAIGDVYFVLYADGATVYNGLQEKDGRNVFTGTSATFRPMVFDKDTNTSSAFAGPITGFALAFDNDDHNHLAMDNLQVRVLAAVPEPESHVLMLAGLALVASITRRRRPALPGR